MTRAQHDVHSPYTFVKGLVTEANKLNQADNSCSDMSNIRVSINGTARRRLGIDYESSGEITLAALQDLSTVAVSVMPWKNVNGDTSISFLAVQAGTVIYLFDLNADPIGAALKGSVDFSTACMSSSSAAQSLCEGAPLSVGLIVVNQYADPFIISYDSQARTFGTSKLTLKVRDFSGIPDGFRVDERPTGLNATHFYNLMNQGWVDPKDSL